MRCDMLTGMITDQLRLAVKRSGKSVLKVAEESGVSQSMLSRFVSGRRDIYLATADKLAAYFGLALRPIEPADVEHAEPPDEAAAKPTRKPKSKRRPKP